MDLLQLWGLARRNWLALLVSLLAGLAIGAGVSFMQPVLYSATSAGYVVAGNSSTVGDAFAGLTQVIAGSVDLADALVPTSQADLWLLPAGRIPPNPSEIVGSGRMESLIAGLAKTYMVVIDAPPLLPVTDAGLLTAVADGAVLVVRHGQTRKEQLALAVRNLAKVDGTLLGFVMNMVPKKDMGSVVYGYGYGSYNPQYYYGEDGGRKPRTKAGRRAQAAQHAGHPQEQVVEEDATPVWISAESVSPATVSPAPAPTAPTAQESTAVQPRPMPRERSRRDVVDPRDAEAPAPAPRPKVKFPPVRQQ